MLQARSLCISGEVLSIFCTGLVPQFFPCFCNVRDCDIGCKGNLSVDLVPLGDYFVRNWHNEIWRAPFTCICIGDNVISPLIHFLLHHLQD